jgi:hypothetical protein
VLGALPPRLHFIQAYAVVFKSRVSFTCSGNAVPCLRGHLKLHLYSDWMLFIRVNDTYLLTYLLTHSMVQNIIWKADCYSAYQKISCFLYGIHGVIPPLAHAS